MPTFRKTLIFVLVGLIVVPQMTFAAWWNPFTWKIFNRAKAPQVEIQKIVPASEIDKLRSEIEELKKKSNTPVVTPLKPPSSISGATPTAVKSTLLTKLTNSQIIGKIKPATVYIETSAGSGSGMIFSTDGNVLTNAHVVKDSTNVSVSLSTGEKIFGTVIGRDETADLALVKINSTKQLPKVDFGDSSKTEQGEEVFTFGFPFGIEGDVSFKEGTISRRIEGYLETSAEIHPGNSGGPLVNRYGQVIGINSAILGNKIQGIQVGETIKFAIPINTAKNLIADLKAGSNKVVQKIYEIIPLGDNSYGTFGDQAARRKIYEEFLQTPGLQYMTPEKQAALLKPRLEAISLEQNARIRREIEAQEAQNAQLRREAEEQQAKINQINSINADCTQRLNTVDSQIVAVKQKYYADVEGLRRDIPSAIYYGQQQALTDAANFEIQKLGNQRESIRIDCLNRLNSFR